MIALTPTQIRVLEMVAGFIQENGYPPSTRDLAHRLGVKAPSVHEQLRKLEQKGYIRRNPLKARSIEILHMPKRITVATHGVHNTEVHRVPVLGEIAAGQPLWAEEHFCGHLEIAIDARLKPGRFFALRIVGDSMIECGIHPGDFVVVRQQPLAENGEIVAALLEDGATVKRLRKDSLQVWLCPENRAYSPIDVTCREDFRILGKVIARVAPDTYRHF